MARPIKHTEPMTTTSYQIPTVRLNKFKTACNTKQEGMTDVLNRKIDEYIDEVQEYIDQTKSK